MYTDYEYYRTAYGGAMKETDFNAAERKSEAVIRYYTYLQGDIFTELDAKYEDALKMACCAGAEAIAARTAKTESGAAAAKAAIKSEDTDGYSVTYATGESDTDAESAMYKAVYQAIKVYLLPTGWLYRGVKVRCCHDYKHDCNYL